MWCTIRHASALHEPINQSPQETTFKRKGFVNSDGVSSYANSANNHTQHTSFTTQKSLTCMRKIPCVLLYNCYCNYSTSPPP